MDNLYEVHELRVIPALHQSIGGGRSGPSSTCIRIPTDVYRSDLVPLPYFLSAFVRYSERAHFFCPVSYPMLIPFTFAEISLVLLCGSGDWHSIGFIGHCFSPLVGHESSLSGLTGIIHTTARTRATNL